MSVPVECKINLSFTPMIQTLLTFLLSGKVIWLALPYVFAFTCQLDPTGLPLYSSHGFCLSVTHTREPGRVISRARLGYPLAPVAQSLTASWIRLRFPIKYTHSWLRPAVLPNVYFSTHFLIIPFSVFTLQS